MSSPLDNLIKTLSKLPSLGPRSAQRAVLFLLKNDELFLKQAIKDMQEVKEKIKKCESCGNFDDVNPCKICSNQKRDVSQLCIVEDVSDLWAMERANFFRGQYHVLGGKLSAIEGVGIEQLNIDKLIERISDGVITEVIFALGATIEGQTTAYYISDLLKQFDIKVSSLAQGIPIGGELNFLDEGTISMAFMDRRALFRMEKNDKIAS